MRMIPDRTRRFKQRPFYQPSELDTECERIVTEFLRRVHGKIEWPITTDDLTKLLEENVRDLDLYADLSSVGVNVEGVTDFSPGMKPRVRICKDLASSAKHENRLRTTLTHELGHVRLHGYLYQLDDENEDLFSARGLTSARQPSASDSSPSQQCRRDTILDSPETNWMEWQAGYACGAFLMPVSYLRQVVEDHKRKHELLGDIVPESAAGTGLIALVSERFCVSKDAARIRLLKTKALSSTFSPSIFR